MVESKQVIHENGQPVKIHLQKNAKGYTWVIDVSGSAVAEILPILREANRKLKGEYGGI